MNNSDDFAKALGQDGEFDASQADKLRTTLVGTFRLSMRKAERHLWCYLCVFLWLLVFTLFSFVLSASTRTQLFYGILTLIFFQTTILLKLWYWVVNSRISVLKAIKQIELVGAGTGTVSDREDGHQTPIDGLSRKERSAWWTALLGGSAVVGALTMVGLGSALDPWPAAEGGHVTSDATVTLAPDGSATSVTAMSSVHRGMSARESVNFYAPEDTLLRFTDGHGQEMDFTTSPHNGHVRYDVRLSQPVEPGRQFGYSRHSTEPYAATEDNGVWSWSSDVSYGDDTNEFTQTVKLPDGAHLISAEPCPVAVFSLGGQEVVRFEATRGRNEPFVCSLQYRLLVDPAE